MGHKAVYDYLVKNFKSSPVYIATSNKVELPKSPFDFSEKKMMMQTTGVPGDRIVLTKNPYQAQEITANYNPDKTVIVFAVSEKDMAEDPRFAFSPKKDGSPSYFQSFAKTTEYAPFSKHGYVMTVPTFDFKVLGKPVRSASEIRAMYVGGDNETRMKIVTELFGKFNQDIFNVMNEKLGALNAG
jgi:hypothetical protein